jgi:hypothetical protein
MGIMQIIQLVGRIKIMQLIGEQVLTAITVVITIKPLNHY